MDYTLSTSAGIRVAIIAFAMARPGYAFDAEPDEFLSDFNSFLGDKENAQNIEDADLTIAELVAMDKDNVIVVVPASDPMQFVLADNIIAANGGTPPDTTDGNGNGVADGSTPCDLSDLESEINKFARLFPKCNPATLSAVLGKAGVDECQLKGIRTLVSDFPAALDAMLVEHGVDAAKIANIKEAFQDAESFVTQVVIALDNAE